MREFSEFNRRFLEPRLNEADRAMGAMRKANGAVVA
jgi:hypothetical protein